MIRLALIASLVLSLGLAGFSLYVTRVNAALEGANARLERSVIALTLQAAQARLARDVERARAVARTARDADLSISIETVLKGGIPDAPLDPDLAALVNRMQSRD